VITDTLSQKAADNSSEPDESTSTTSMVKRTSKAHI